MSPVCLPCMDKTPLKMAASEQKAKPREKQIKDKGQGVAWGRRAMEGGERMKWCDLFLGSEVERNTGYVWGTRDGRCHQQWRNMATDIWGVRKEILKLLTRASGYTEVVLTDMRNTGTSFVDGSRTRWEEADASGLVVQGWAADFRVERRRKHMICGDFCGGSKNAREAGISVTERLSGDLEGKRAWDKSQSSRALEVREGEGSDGA